MKIKSLALVAVGAFSMATMTAHAWTVTTQGTISYGYDSTGIFGTVNANLSGMAFTQAIATSTDTAKWSNNYSYPEYSYQGVYGSGPNFTNTVTVNGYTVTFNSLSSNWGQQHIANDISNGGINNYVDYIYSYQSGYTANNDYVYAINYAYSYYTPFVPTLNFDQTIFQNLDSSFNGYAEFQTSGSQSAYFYGTPNSIMVNGEVPEPAPLALLGLGALGLIAARRKRANSKNV